MCSRRSAGRSSSPHLELLESHAGAVVRHVVDAARPHETVARFVAAPRSVRHRRHDAGCDPVLDHEREQRLRQEARLEDATTVLVRDAALASVTDCLDDGHADVTGLVLDGVDHRLDALAHDDGLDLDHKRRSRKTVSLQIPSRFAIRSRVPTTRNPQRSCSAIDARFSGKIDVWIIQIPDAWAASINPSSSCLPTPRPRASRATYTVFSTTPA